MRIVLASGQLEIGITILDDEEIEFGVRGQSNAGDVHLLDSISGMILRLADENLAASVALGQNDMRQE